MGLLELVAVDAAAFRPDTLMLMINHLEKYIYKAISDFDISQCTIFTEQYFRKSDLKTNRTGYLVAIHILMKPTVQLQPIEMNVCF